MLGSLTGMWGLRGKGLTWHFRDTEAPLDTPVKLTTFMDVNHTHPPAAILLINHWGGPCESDSSLELLHRGLPLQMECCVGIASLSPAVFWGWMVK